MCAFCFAVNGEHKPGCSRGANVTALPRRIAIKIVNPSPSEHAYVLLS